MAGAAMTARMEVPDTGAGARGVDAPDLRLFVFALFFIFGGITSLNDVLIPKLKELFTLSYAEAMLVQSAFFAAYFVVSLPAAALVRRIGYLRAAALGLVTMTAGCLLFIPASLSGRFALFLAALFVLASGITTVQVVANPLISLLGPARSTPSRLTFAQAFNALGTTVFPLLGASLILGSLATVDPARLAGDALIAYRAAETQMIVRTYLALAAVILVVALLVWRRRDRLAGNGADGAAIADAGAAAPKGRLPAGIDLLVRPRFGLGAMAIFLYVGAEVAIGSVIVNYLMQADVLGLGERAAGQHVPLYWGGALIGRFAGAALMRRIAPGAMLAGVAAGAITLLAVAAAAQGVLSGYALLAIGLCNAIMFPTIFSLACAGLGPRAADGSGLICVMIVGGALIPPLTGHVADLAGLRAALLVPALCYGAIAGFGLFARRTAAE